MQTQQTFALVTGASQGLGKAFAQSLAGRGWNLILVALPGERLPALARDLEARYGITAIAVEADLAREDEQRRLLDAAQGEGRKIGLLVNNVGVGCNGLFDLIPLEAQRRAVEVNIQATMSITYGLLPRLAESGGHVLIVASLAAFYPMPLFAVYAASKSFLLHWGLALRHEVEALGVSVTVLTPGGINTSEEIREKNRSQGLPGRLSSKEPEEVAAIALRGAFKGRAVVVPGAFNRMLLRLGTLLTKNATAGAIYQRWLRTLGKVEGSADAAWFIRKRDAA